MIFKTRRREGDSNSRVQFKHCATRYHSKSAKAQEGESSRERTREKQEWNKDIERTGEGGRKWERERDGVKGRKRGWDGWWGRVLFTTLVQLVDDSAEGSSGRARAFSKNQ